MVSAANSATRAIERMDRFTQGHSGPIVTVDNSTVAVARASHCRPGAELMDLTALVDVSTRGLPGLLGWPNPMHNALARASGRSRKWRAGGSIPALPSPTRHRTQDAGCQPPSNWISEAVAARGW